MKQKKTTDIRIHDQAGAISTTAAAIGADEDTTRAIIAQLVTKRQKELYSYATDERNDHS